jgi:regulator of replication initiation timing
MAQNREHHGLIDPEPTLRDVFDEVDGVKQKVDSAIEQINALSKLVEKLRSELATLDDRLDQ